MRPWEWETPDDHPVLDRDQVHVWQAHLDLPQSEVRNLWATLSPDEQMRAERFHFTRDRDRFTVARGLVRALLGGYLGVLPAALRLSYSAHGKPMLGRDYGADLRFNVSHSHELALFGFVLDHDIGIDIELIRPEFASMQVAERYFSERELGALMALPEWQRAEGFFNCWTRKEAYIKARGEGLSLPLQTFDVSLAPSGPATLLATRNEPRDALRWSLHRLEPEQGYVAALAVEGHGWRLHRWRYPRPELRVRELARRTV